MSLNLRHLNLFREVARRGSISAASTAAHLSQPAVTQAIAGVERYFGASLLNRGSAGVSLTPAGRLCADRIERALGQLREVTTELSTVRADRARDTLRQLRTAQLQALDAVVKHRSFTLAARATGLSQPTIHRAARSLERAIGVPLFEKTSFGVVPTREAERLSRRARLAFAEIEQARAEIRALAGIDSGKTVIGAMPLARSYLLPRALLDFTREFPTHRTSILEGPYEHLLGALQSGAADCLIGALRHPRSLSGVVQEHLFDDPLAIIARAGHPLARRRRVAPAELARYPWIAPRSESPLHTHFRALFSAARVREPLQPIECNSLTAARTLLLESDCLMLLSPHQIHYERAAGHLIALPHPGGNVARSIGLTLREDWQPTRAQQGLLDLLREHARALGTDSLSRGRPVERAIIPETD